MTQQGELNSRRDGVGDGRNIDEKLGSLAGEGSLQEIEQPDPHPSRTQEVWHQRPVQTHGDEPTYYDRPVLKEPVWIWAVPAYFYVGGVAGAAATLGAVAQLLKGEQMRDLVVRCRWVAAVNGMIGSGFLIYDLGRPERFLNMLRVFRVTSPMSVGSWLLAAAGGLTFGSAMLSHTRGALRRLGDLAAILAALVGMPLAGYTAVLLANSAVPVWQQSRRQLPFIFIASAMASAASLLKFMRLSPAEEKVIDSFAVVGQASELATFYATEKALDQIEPVGKPLHAGLSGALLKISKLLGALHLALSLIPGRSKSKRVAEGICGTLAAITLRFGIFYAGSPSARDPHATFRTQRRGRGAAEVTGQPAVTGSQDRATRRG
jgi:formate-dependent nitrite reductase membrane component NrfD